MLTSSWLMMNHCSYHPHYHCLLPCCWSFDHWCPHSVGDHGYGDHGDDDDDGGGYGDGNCHSQESVEHLTWCSPY